MYNSYKHIYQGGKLNLHHQLQEWLFQVHTCELFWSSAHWFATMGTWASVFNVHVILGLCFVNLTGWISWSMCFVLHMQSHHCKYTSHFKRTLCKYSPISLNSPFSQALNCLFIFPFSYFGVIPLPFALFPVVLFLLHSTQSHRISVLCNATMWYW